MARRISFADRVERFNIRRKTADRGILRKTGSLAGWNYHNYRSYTKGIKSLAVALTGRPGPRKDQVLTFKGVRKGVGWRKGPKGGRWSRGRGIELKWRCA